jgi:hypothetical protein
MAVEITGRDAKSASAKQRRLAYMGRFAESRVNCSVIVPCPERGRKNRVGVSAFYWLIETDISFSAP